MYFSDFRSGVSMVGRVPIDGSVPPQNLAIIQYGAIGMFSFYYHNSVVHVFPFLVRAEDLAMDWIANNLYWTDSFYNRLEVLDLDIMYRTELLRTGAHTAPRAIVVDPNTR